MARPGIVALSSWRFRGKRMLAAIEEDFDYGAPDYSRLLQHSNATAFQHPVWMDAMRTCLLEQHNSRLMTLTVRETNGALVFAMPLIARARHGLRLLEMPDFGVTDYNAPVLAPELAQDMEWLTGLRAELMRCLPSHDVFRIRKVRAEHQQTLRTLFPGDWCQLEYSAHATDPFEDHALWRNTALRPSFVKTLDRKKRGFFKSGDGQVRKLTESEEVGDAVKFIARIRQGRFEKDLMQLEAYRRFYTSLAEKDETFAKVFVLESGSDTVGVLLGLVRGRRFYYLLIGCDYEGYGKYSPGYILYDEVFRMFIEEGGEIFDFTVGDEKFKFQFGAKSSALFELEQGASFPGKMAVAAKKALQKLKLRQETEPVS